MRPIYVAITSFKGGVGCSTLTVLIASRFHYQLKKRVAIVDCDELQHFCCGLRAMEVHKPTEYPILPANIDNALNIASTVPDETEIVFFDLPKSGCFDLMWKMDIVYFAIAEKMVVTSWLKTLFQMAEDAKGKGVDTFFRAFLTKCDSKSTARLWNMATFSGVPFEVKVVILESKVPDKKYYSLQKYNNYICVSTEEPMDFYLVKKTNFHPIEADILKLYKLLINHRTTK